MGVFSFQIFFFSFWACECGCVRQSRAALDGCRDVGRSSILLDAGCLPTGLVSSLDAL